VKTVAAGDEVALEPQHLAAMPEAYVRAFGRDVHRLDLFGFGEQVLVAPVGGGE
jgi:hypothetical protein